MGKKCKGAVSIFMIIVTFCSFMLGSVFIDGARILVARNRIQSAMDSAVRSTMSYYDENLISEYGLYGIDGEIVNDKFNKYFEVNLQRTKYDGVNLFEYTIANSSMTADEAFGNSMSRQIQEYEKYRMPVTTTMIVVDKVKDMVESFSKGLNKTKNAADAVKTLEDKMSVASKNVKKYGKAIGNNIKTNLRKAVTSGVTTLLKDGAEKATTAVLGKDIDSYLQEARDEINKMKAELKELKEKRDAYSKESKKLDQPSESDVIDGDTEEEKEAKEKGEAEGKKFENTEQEINNEINNLEKEIANLEKAIFGEGGIEKRLKAEQKNTDRLIEDWKSAEKSLKSAEASLATAKGNYENEKAKLGITKMEKSLTEQETKVNELKGSITSILKLLESREVQDDFEEYKETFENEDEERREELEEKYKDDESVINCFNQYKEQYEAQKELDRLEQEVSAINNRLSVYKAAITDAEKAVEACEIQVENCKTKIKNKSEDMEKIVDELGNLIYPDFKAKVIDDLSTSAKDAFDDGVKTFLKGTSFDEIFEAFTLKMPELDPENEELETESGLMKMYDIVVEEFSNLAKVVTDADKFVEQAMYIDYIMGKCTYLTSQNAKNHYFEIAEVEYILFGFDTQVKNVTATLAAIYGIRFGVNFINYFITTPGEFFARLSAGFTRGLAQSALDLSDMLIAKNKEAPGCALCPSFKHVKLSYSDHLRLLLLMKFTNSDMKALENTMNQTLITNYEGKPTTELYASANATAEVGINLIMIPAFTDLLPLGDKFRDGKYYITVSGSYSY